MLLDSLLFLHYFYLHTYSIISELKWCINQNVILHCSFVNLKFLIYWYIKYFVANVCLLCYKYRQSLVFLHNL